MNNSQRISLCNSALEASKQLLNADVYSEIHDYINKHNEWGIGIEMLIDTLSEEDIKIELEQFTKIQAAMDSMGLGKSDRMQVLMQHIKNT